MTNQQEGPTKGNGQQTVSALEARLAYESEEEAAMEAGRHQQEDEASRARAEVTVEATFGETSWEAIDLGPYVDGTVRINPPEFFPRSDGSCLLYAGKTHYFIGESESGKTWAALLAIKDVLERGLGAMFVDYEDDAATFVTGSDSSASQVTSSGTASASRMSIQTKRSRATMLSGPLQELGPRQSHRL